MKIRMNTNIIKESINNIFKILLFVSILQCIPIITSLIYEEYNIAICFGISMCISIIACSIGFLFTNNYVKIKSNFGTNLVIASITWIGVSAISAMALYFCGDFSSYLDAFFDSMSGLTTSGFTLINDLDHVSKGVNMWRHMISFIGAQGLIVFALAFVIKNARGIFKMYEAEAKDEKIYPSTSHTAKFIIKISLIYMVIGTIALTLTGRYIGMSWDNSFLHGIWIFMATWSCCGFAPMSQNVLYYHSGLYELVMSVFMILATFNFGLHFTAMHGNPKEIFKNSEIRTFVVILIFITIMSLIGLSILNVYPNGMAYARKGLFQVICAMSTSGYTNMYSTQFIAQWGGIAVIAIMLAMICGGSMNSAGGGIKMLRINVIFKTIIENIKSTVYPEGKISVKKVHHNRDIILTDKMFKSAAIMFISFILLGLIGTIITTGFGYGIVESLFEATSAVSNTGLSIGIISKNMPTVLKYTYILLMWIARLEFVSVFMLIGFIYKIFKKRGVTKIELEMDE